MIAELGKRKADLIYTILHVMLILGLYRAATGDTFTAIGGVITVISTCHALTITKKETAAYRIVICARRQSAIAIASIGLGLLWFGKSTPAETYACFGWHILDIAAAIYINYVAIYF